MPFGSQNMVKIKPKMASKQQQQKKQKSSNLRGVMGVIDVHIKHSISLYNMTIKTDQLMVINNQSPTGNIWSSVTFPWFNRCLLKGDVYVESNGSRTAAPKGMKSCRIQGEFLSVRLSVRPFITPLGPPKSKSGL